MNSTTIGVANANFVTPQLAVGGDLDMHNITLETQQVADLVDGGITHILDVRHECSDESVWQHVPHLTYRWEGIHDAGQRVPVAWFDTVVSWALHVLEDPDAKLLTHCHMGINRGPSAGCHHARSRLGPGRCPGRHPQRSAHRVRRVRRGRTALASLEDRGQSRGESTRLRPGGAVAQRQRPRHREGHP
jgi:predicted protein tyrosine phosphatase